MIIVLILYLFFNKLLYNLKFVLQKNNIFFIIIFFNNLFI